MSFVTPEVLTKLGSLSAATADRAEFAIVQLDSRGGILMCNHYACELTGIRRGDGPGRSFFLDFAPWAANPIFEGRFLDGVACGELNLAFTYCFRWSERLVPCQVHLILHKATSTYWAFIQKIRESERAWLDSFRSLDEQLAALYGERLAKPARSAEPPAPVLQLVAAPAVSNARHTDEAAGGQIERLTREKLALEAELDALKRRAKDIGAAMFEAALLNRKVASPVR